MSTTLDMRNIYNQKLILFGLSSLSDKHREVINLHCLNGFTMEEVAEILEVSIGTVKSRIHTAKKNLHDIFKKNGVIYE
jgi:RNA polymerase sigma-70 factor (ECF subfamily)